MTMLIVLAIGAMYGTYVSYQRQRVRTVLLAMVVWVCLALITAGYGMTQQALLVSFFVLSPPIAFKAGRKNASIQ